ncbi:MAG TPA: hypothetical protein VF210_22025 [Pseudomonadales bacterium]
MLHPNAGRADSREVRLIRAMFRIDSGDVAVGCRRSPTGRSAITDIARSNSALIWAHDKGVQTATEADRAGADPVGARRLATRRGPEGKTQRARAAPAPRKHPRHCPVHVTVRLQRGLPNLRRKRFVSAFRYSLAQCAERPGFRVVHYPIQHNHLHFLIEAQGKRARVRDEEPRSEGRTLREPGVRPPRKRARPASSPPAAAHAEIPGR